VDGSVFLLDHKGVVLRTEGTDPFSITSSGMFYPRAIVSRVPSQRGVFSISSDPQVSFEISKGNFDIQRLVIEAKSKPKMQKVLQQYNINEYSIYQDLDNLSNYLNRLMRIGSPVEK
jgi:hypothetical protein